MSSCNHTGPHSAACGTEFTSLAEAVVYRGIRPTREGDWGDLFYKCPTCFAATTDPSAHQRWHAGK